MGGMGWPFAEGALGQALECSPWEERADGFITFLLRCPDIAAAAWHWTWLLLCL